MGLDATIKWDAEKINRQDMLSAPSEVTVEDTLEKLREAFPEIIDISMPSSGTSAFVIISMLKEHAGQSQSLLKSIWEFSQQNLDARFVILCDDDVNVHDWNDIIWAITTRMDPLRDATIVQKMVGRAQG